MSAEKAQCVRWDGWRGPRGVAGRAVGAVGRGEAAGGCVGEPEVRSAPAVSALSGPLSAEWLGAERVLTQVSLSPQGKRRLQVATGILCGEAGLQRSLALLRAPGADWVGCVAGERGPPGGLGASDVLRAACAAERSRDVLVRAASRWWELMPIFDDPAAAELFHELRGWFDLG